MEDKRIVNRITVYWNGLRKDLPLPQWERFNPASIDDIWPQCCVWRVEAGNDKLPLYTYEYIGAGVREALGVDPTGVMFNSHFRNFPGARIVRNMDDVVKNLSLLVDDAQFVNEKDKIVKYRSCLLPFGNKQGRVTHILLALSWRSF